MLIVTNIGAFPPCWTAADGTVGTSVVAKSVSQYVLGCRRRDAILLINCDPGLVMRLCALFILAPPLRRPLVAVDLVLRRPAGRFAGIKADAKSLLFSRVDLFVHYFKDLRGYQELFGIGPERSRFVHFKPNLRHRQNVRPQPDGKYVLCLGRSMRDYDTFFDAVARLPYAAAIPKPDWSQLTAHGARFTCSPDQIPRNVRVLDDDGSAETLVRMIEGAKLVVLPILKASMAASGVSVALNAMLLGKCVIASEGPGMSDVLSDEILNVPPEDPVALAAVIARAWEDDELRGRTAASGFRYALSLGGESELYQRILDQVVAWREVVQ